MNAATAGNEKVRAPRAKLLPICIGWGALWIAWALCHALFDEQIGIWDFIVWLVAFGVWCLLVLIALIALFCAKHARPGASLLVCVLSLASVATLTKFGIGDEIEWQVKRRGFATVAAKIQSGELKVKSGQRTLNLPRRFAWLSTQAGGMQPVGVHRVLVQRKGAQLKVAFISALGFLGGDDAYVYCSDGRAPRPDDFGWQLTILQTKNARWYRCRDNSSWN